MTFNDLTPAAIKQFAGATIFQRGKDYYENEMVLELEYDPDRAIIEATVEGSNDTYEVTISQEKSDLNAECDCLYEGYPCKHVVAVLLQFYHQQADLQQKATTQKKQTPNLEDQIQRLGKEALIELILTGIKKYPDFKRELDESLRITTRP